MHFGYSEENESAVRDFFRRAEAGGIPIVWEPRGDWLEHSDVLKSIFDDHGVVHATDLLRRPPLSSAGPAYVRLHGLNEREFNYRYDYHKEEIERLATELRKLEETCEEVFCLFNNENMYENADTLKEILSNG